MILCLWSLPPLKKYIQKVSVSDKAGKDLQQAMVAVLSFVGSIYLFEKATKMMLQEICLRLIIYPQKFCIWSLSKKDTSCIKVFLLWSNNHNGTWAGKGIMCLFCSLDWTGFLNSIFQHSNSITFMDIILYCKNILFWNPVQVNRITHDPSLWNIESRNSTDEYIKKYDCYSKEEITNVRHNLFK